MILEESNAESAIGTKMPSSSVYKGAPHGMCTTHKDNVNEELLAFIKRDTTIGATA
jgi:non-heme chloroperoxidase